MHKNLILVENTKITVFTFFEGLSRNKICKKMSYFLGPSRTVVRNLLHLGGHLKNKPYPPPQKASSFFNVIILFCS